jgi:RNA polymerase-associated protein
MAVVSSKRSVMTLFSGPLCVHSHRARIVLAEKGITHEVTPVAGERFPEDLLDLNPYASVPTLVDRDLVIYYSRVIIEYLDERFPHPPLMPVDPVSRARARLALTRVESEWYPEVERIQAGGGKAELERARKVLSEGLVSSAEVFAAKPFFLSDDFSLVDCTIAPVLWRLPTLGVEVPKQAQAVRDYAERMFARDSFKAALSEAERELRRR